jgi:hypothetical protein
VLPHTTGTASLPHRLCCKLAHKTPAKKAYEYPMCSLTQCALEVYLTGCVASRLTKRPQRMRTSIQCSPSRNGRFKSTAPVVSQVGSQNVRKEGVRASNVFPHATGASSLHHQLVSSSPFQGQQLPACVRVTTAESSGVSPRVS